MFFRRKVNLLLLLIGCRLWVKLMAQSGDACLDLSLQAILMHGFEIKYVDLLVKIPNTYWQNCLRQCARRVGICFALSYNKRTRVCQLGSSLDLKAVEPDLSLAVVTITRFYIASFGGTCAGVHCGFQKSCVPLSSGQTTCITTGCSSKPTLIHGSHSGDGHQINAQISFTCDTGYNIRGATPTSTCKADGRWTAIKFSCANNICPLDLQYTMEGSMCYKITPKTSGSNFWSKKKLDCLNDGARLPNVFEGDRISFFKDKLLPFSSSYVPQCYYVDGWASNRYSDIFFLYGKMPYNTTSLGDTACWQMNDRGEVYPGGCNDDCGHICEVPLD